MTRQSARKSGAFNQTVALERERWYREVAGMERCQELEMRGKVGCGAWRVRLQMAGKRQGGIRATSWNAAFEAALGSLAQGLARIQQH